MEGLKEVVEIFSKLCIGGGTLMAVFGVYFTYQGSQDSNGPE